MSDDELLQFRNSVHRAIEELRAECRRLSLQATLSESVLVACCVSIAKDPVARASIEVTLDRLISMADRLTIPGAEPFAADMIAGEAQDAANRLARMIRAHLPPR